MDFLYEKLIEIENIIDQNVVINDDLENIEYLSSLLYLKYSLEIVEKKLTNSLDKRDLEKILGLKKNFEYVENKRKINRI